MSRPVRVPPDRAERRARWRDRLGIGVVIVMLLLLLFMMVDGAVLNFQCKFSQFITFQCNRWDATFKRW